jgi:hypothetical protein
MSAEQINRPSEYFISKEVPLKCSFLKLENVTFLLLSNPDAYLQLELNLHAAISDVAAPPFYTTLLMLIISGTSSSILWRTESTSE